ncbi:MAG TPA: DUF3592 domain-containing protein [Candidatus Angelobacter sp.]|nr:DUF3592 domain-containing protein [Candidatus Angelobacter sp.]
METWTRNSPATNKPFSLQNLIGLLVLFTGLCAIFALVVSVSDSWREHMQQNWPQATAVIKHCSVDPYVPFRRAGGTPIWYIRCQIGYSVHGNQIEASIRSRSTKSGWGGSLEAMHEWVYRNRPGSPIIIHYDPNAPQTAALIATDMPDAGPRTPNNLKLFLIASVFCLGLWMIARHLRTKQPS